MKASDLATAIYKTYVFKGIRYLPHYTEQGVFVAPGFSIDNDNSVLESTLVKKNAKMVLERLWCRTYQSASR